MTTEQADKVESHLVGIKMMLAWMVVIVASFMLFRGCSSCRSTTWMPCDAARVGDQYADDDRLLECVRLRRSTGEVEYRIVTR